jgi:hypothetical protein
MTPTDWDAPHLRRRFVTAAMALAAIGVPRLVAAQSDAPVGQAREENAYVLGVLAYLWGFPLRFYEVTEAEGLRAGAVGLNTYRRYTELKTARDRFVVTPNNVTIDAYASYDVGQEPLVIVVPVLARPRWYLVQIGDSFDEIVRNLGGIHGPQPGAYLLTGPDFRGTVPGEMARIATRTPRGPMAVRIFANNEADLPGAVEAQKGFHIIPLSAYLREGLAYRPAQAVASPSFESQAPAPLRFFDELGFAMRRRLPAAADWEDAIVAALRQVGLSAARGFDWRALDEATRRGLQRAIPAAERIMDARWQTTGEVVHGWRYTMAAGRAGHDFALRAALTKNQLGAQLAEQVLYPNTQVDDRNEVLTGTRRYELRFARNGLPPVATFWNLAMYDKDNLFVENQFGRYSIGSTTDGLKTAADGSVTILIQQDRPADTSNWLPTPDDTFNLTMRFYGPLTPVLDASYRLPAVQRVG